MQRDTCSPFKAHKQYLDQKKKEERMRHEASQYKLVMSPNAKEAMELEKRRKQLYPSQVVSANTLNLQFQHHLKKSVLVFN